MDLNLIYRISGNIYHPVLDKLKYEYTLKIVPSITGTLAYDELNSTGMNTLCRLSSITRL